MSMPHRRKLWDHEDYQCSILGTCLAMPELRKLARKLGATLKPKATDYEVHAFFVHACRQESPMSAFINKYLDKKYRKALRLFAKADEETALAAMWRHAVKTGDVPGPFWALMSHPAASKALLSEAFGEVHMLSHLMGAANRADVKRLSWLERRLGEITQALARVQVARRAGKLEWAKRIRDLEQSLSLERAERQRLSRLLHEYAPLQSGQPDPGAAWNIRLLAARKEILRQVAIIEELYSQNAKMRTRMDELSADLERAEMELVRTMPCAEGGGCQLEGGSCQGGDCHKAHSLSAFPVPVAISPARAKKTARKTDACAQEGPQAASQEAFSRLPATQGGPPPAAHAAKKNSSCPCGGDCACGGNGGCREDGICRCAAKAARSVLYVGGRQNLVCHYRELVERQGLCFHHHDGGRENSIPELYGKLASADVVLCPVDCVSHEACQSVKKACKHCLKHFVPLRSSGLSTLARSLDDLTERVN